MDAVHALWPNEVRDVGARGHPPLAILRLDHDGRSIVVAVQGRPDRLRDDREARDVPVPDVLQASPNSATRRPLA